MEGRHPNRRGESLTPRQKRVFVIVTGVLLAAAAAVSAWAAVSPGSYGRSANGCVNVVEPSSMGGAIMHQCGGAARTMCRRAYARTDRLALLTRPQCRLAGIAPPPGPVPAATP
jgi:Mg-chelatase subunit ChlD